MTDTPESAPRTDAGDEQNPQPSPFDLKPFYVIISAVGVTTTLGGYLLAGLDFALATLLGFTIVAANFIWTKNLVKALLIDREKPPALLTISYFIKFGITAVVLYFALIRYNMDALGILVGLSALMLATFIYAYYAKPPRSGKQNETNWS